MMFNGEQFHKSSELLWVPMLHLLCEHLSSKTGITKGNKTDL